MADDPNTIPPPDGCDFYTSSRGIDVARIHYSADPTKTPEWAEKKKEQAVSEQMHMQEMEIEANAQSGARLFPKFEKKYTVVEPFPIPHDATRYMAGDPHPRVPHFWLWMAVTKYDDWIFYREYWPSKVYAKRGAIPEDDDSFEIDDYAKAIKFMESEKNTVFAENGLADNGGREEKIQRRYMDYSAKAWMAEVTKGKKGNVSFWDSYRKQGIICDECDKDMEASVDLINTNLRPRTIIGPDGKKREQSRILIFNTLPELILEFERCRYPQLTPHQQEIKDPSDKPMEKRKHGVDCARYICMSKPVYTDPNRARPRSVKKMQKGVSY